MSISRTVLFAPVEHEEAVVDMHKLRKVPLDVIVESFGTRFVAVPVEHASPYRRFAGDARDKRLATREAVREEGRKRPRGPVFGSIETAERYVRARGRELLTLRHGGFVAPPKRVGESLPPRLKISLSGNALVAPLRRVASPMRDVPRLRANDVAHMVPHPFLPLLFVHTGGLHGIVPVDLATQAVFESIVPPHVPIDQVFCMAIDPTGSRLAAGLRRGVGIFGISDKTAAFARLPTDADVELNDSHFCESCVWNSTGTMLAFGGAGGQTGFAVTSARGELLMESSALNVAALAAHPTDDVLVVATFGHMFTCEFGGTGVGTVFDSSFGISALAASKDCIVGCCALFPSAAVMVWAWDAPQCLLKIDGFDGSLGRRTVSYRSPLSWSGSVLAVCETEPDIQHGVVRLWDTSDADPAHWEYRGMLPARSFSSEAVVLPDGAVAFVTDDGRLSVFA